MSKKTLATKKTAATKNTAATKATRTTTTDRPKTAAGTRRTAESERPHTATIAGKGRRPAPGTQDHEVPTAKEIANTTHAVTPAKAKRQNAGNAAKREPTAKRASGLDLAVRALAAAKTPLNAKAIAERVLAAGWTTSGKTPHATLYAAMIREIAAKGKDARFRKSDRGLFVAASVGKGG